MLLWTTLIICLSLLHFHLPLAYAKCCVRLINFKCGDGTNPTPCCGYVKCQFGCCDCKGVTAVESVVSNCGPTYTSYINAPPGKTWTCRDVHLQTLPKCHTQRDVSLPTAFIDSNEPSATPIIDSNEPSATITRMTRPTSLTSLARSSDQLEAVAELRRTFNDMCGGRKHNGAEVVTLDDYFGFFNVTGDHQGSDFSKSVAAKFRAHDVNGDGMVDFDEAQLYCDADGCES